MLTDISFLLSLGIVATGVCLGCPIGRFCLCANLHFSGNDTLVLYMLFIYNFGLSTFSAKYRCI